MVEIFHIKSQEIPTSMPHLVGHIKIYNVHYNIGELTFSQFS